MARIGVFVCHCGEHFGPLSGGRALQRQFLVRPKTEPSSTPGSDPRGVL